MYRRPFTLSGFLLPSAQMKIRIMQALVWPSLLRMVRKLLRQRNQLGLCSSEVQPASSDKELPHLVHILSWKLLVYVAAG